VAKPVPAFVDGIYTDVVYQQIHAVLDTTEDAVVPDETMLSSAEADNEGPEPSSQPEHRDDYPPLGLERHYPVEEPPRPEPSSDVSASAESAAPPATPDGLSFDELGVPSGASAAEGLTSSVPEVNALDSVQSRVDTSASEPMFGQVPEATQPQTSSAEQSQSSSQADTPTEQSHADVARPETQPVAAEVPVKAEVPVHTGSASANEQSARAEGAPPAVEQKSVAAANAEPFVNETMAKLYLKQGYKQLALKVYRQLVYARPNDQSLKDRIAEIEAADAAEHPGEFPAARREPPAEERATEERATEARPAEARPTEERPAETEQPRAPSIERAEPATSPESEEDAFDFGTPQPDSQPTREPARERESVETSFTADRHTAREEVARQPSIREFFATLGRRRPPRPSSGGGFRPQNSSGGNSSMGSGSMAQSSMSAPADQRADAPASFGAAGPAPSLDSVFAGATVSPSDARAASRLAGAFSGAAGASRTPPTPPMPTPRVNPRVQAQESEEDVAKFRAWLDGLTGE
jgi:hypothetical protein